VQIKIKLFSILLVISFTFAQVTSQIDTLNGLPGEDTFQLKNGLILEASCQVIIDGKWVEDAHINEAEGIITLNKPLSDSTRLLVTYNYSELSLPLQVGPLYSSLPLFDPLDVKTGADQDQIIKNNAETIDPYQNVISTGTVYRHIQVNPLGGSNFGGGMQIQIQGNLNKDIHVSGVLTDQQIGIQPEGNTQELDDFDRIYLKVDHKNFNITAGDIDYNMSTGKSFEIRRKLTGLKQNFHYKDFKGSSVFGGSNGKFNEVDLIGTDGNQGPYQLRSMNGNSDIIILSGTEKVYLNGDLMTRGENHDYVIDYTLGELFFTPKNMIQYDSDIHVEYQYSDFQYSRNTAGGVLSKSILKNSQLTIGWIKEYDQYDKQENKFSQEILDTLGTVGDQALILSSAIPDSSGDYIIANGIYNFSEENIETKYSVSFQNDPVNGQYIRKISSRGKLYYEFIPEEERTELLEMYSPFRNVIPPESKDIVYLGGVFPLHPALKLNFEITSSNLDKNILSHTNDNNNLGTDYRMAVSGKNTGMDSKILIGYSLDFWNRTKEFSPLQRDRDINFLQDWDLPDEINSRESKIDSRINVSFRNFGRISTAYSIYRFGQFSRDRIQNSVFVSKGLINAFDLNQNLVRGNNNNFTQWSSRISLLKGKIHPFMEGEFEESTGSHQFYWFNTGLDGEIKHYTSSISIGRRLDFITTSESDELSEAGDSYYGAFELKGSNNGLSQEVEFRKRIKDFPLNKTSMDYELLRLKVNYYRSTSPVKFDLQSKLEESATETRAVVYDSVGQGFGQYRYDPVFNEFIEDPNGPYRHYTIFSGDRHPTTHFENSFRSQWNFRRSSIKLLRGLTLDGNIRSEYRGNYFQPGNIMQYALPDTLLRAFINYSLEGVYRQSGSTRRFRLGLQNKRDLNGLDPRGNSLSNRLEINSEIQEPLSGFLTLINRIQWHKGDRVSAVMLSRTRDYSGWNSEFGLKTRGSKVWRIEGFIQGGKDIGNTSGKDFTAGYYGLKSQIIRFTGKSGRIEFLGEWNYGSGTLKFYDLPPEVMNKVTIGENIRLQLRGQYLIGNYFSLNTTIAYLNNARYDQFITMTGELRAYF